MGTDSLPLCLSCMQRDTSSKLTDLPREILARIVSGLDMESLERLGQTCQVFRYLCGSIRFKSISVGACSRFLDFIEGTTQLSPSLAYGLATHAQSLHLSCTHHIVDDQKVPDTMPFFAILKTCNRELLQKLTLDGSDHEESMAKSESEFLDIANTKRFRCHSLGFRMCCWSLAEPFIIHAGSSLRRLEWSAPTQADVGHQGSGFNLLASQVPNLKSLCLRVTDGNHLALLVCLAPQLEHLETSTRLWAKEAACLAASWFAAQPLAWSFPNLLSFSADHLLHEIYLSIIANSPRLRKIGKLRMPGIDSLLATIPSSIQFLGFTDAEEPTQEGIYIGQKQEPLETLVERFSRFKHLKKLPKVVYIDEKYHKSAFPTTRDMFLAHFDALGVKSSEEERRNFLQFNGISSFRRTMQILRRNRFVFLPDEHLLLENGAALSHV